jgi:hypothetical protein
VRLVVGLTARSVWWEHLLAQEGVSFEYANLHALDKQWSVLVVTHALNETERRQVEEYLSAGGAVMGYAAYLQNVCKTTSRSELIEYLTSDGTPPFPDTHLIDLGIMGEIPREANCLRTQHHTFAAFAGEMGGGWAVILPFDAAAVMTDHRAAHKSFYAQRDRLPSERVSLVGKGEVQRLVHRALVFLHHARNVPYAHLWYFPGEHRTLFAFRIDSDRGSRQEIDTLYRLAVQHDIALTWFLDVKSHEDWLHHFAFLAGQEFGIHCYEHRVLETFEAAMKDIVRARQKLERVGVSSPGFAAPFGMWSTGLARALDQIGFEYSSEFSYAYDAHPLYPHAGSDTFSTMQIPIHPICIGSMLRVGYSETHMADYFQRVMDEKLLRNESWFFYHHPTHRAWDVVRFLFHYVKQRGIGCTTLGDYARWWKKRLRTMPRLVLRDRTLFWEGPLPEESVRLRILLPDMREALVAVNFQINLDAIAWQQPQRVAVAPPDIHRIREFDPRKLVGDLFTTLSRKFSERKTE